MVKVGELTAGRPLETGEPVERLTDRAVGDTKGDAGRSIVLHGKKKAARYDDSSPARDSRVALLQLEAARGHIG